MGDNPGQMQGSMIKNQGDLVTIILLIVVLILLYRMVCKDTFVSGLDSANYLDSGCVNDYDITDMRGAAPYGSMGWVGSGAALAGVGQRTDWMTNRFTTSARDNFISSGFCGDSVTTPGGIIAGPVFGKNDMRDYVGQAKSSLTQAPILSTQEMTELIQYE